MRGSWMPSAALILAIASAALSSAPVWAQLSDVSTHWAAEYIRSLAQQQVLGGFPDGTFRPTQQVTRAQFAVIVTKAFGLDTNVPMRRFRDEIPGWAAPSIGAASAANFISGFPDGTFRPNDVLTRAQAITVLTKAANVGLIDPAQADEVLGLYQDQGQIPNFARVTIATATREGLLVLYPQPNRINATAVATRGEVAALTHLAMAKVGKVPPLPVPVGATVPQGNLAVIPPQAPTPPIETVATAPVITQLVTSAALGSVKPGDSFTLVMQGSPGARASFSIPAIVEDVQMRETRPGQYEGRYVFRQQDKANKTSVVARLEKDGLVSTAQLLNKPISIGQVSDTSFPVVRDLAPSQGSSVSILTPEISGRFQDDQGIDLNSFSLLVNNVDVSSQAKLTQNSFSYTPSQPLPAGKPISVSLQIADINGNTTFQEWKFEVKGP